MLKEPILFARRGLASPTRRSMLSTMDGSTTKRRNKLGGLENSSTMIARLSTSTRKAEDEDEEIEIFGPFPAHSSKENVDKKLSSAIRQAKTTDSRGQVQPFFLSASPVSSTTTLSKSKHHKTSTVSKAGKNLSKPTSDAIRISNDNTYTSVLVEENLHAEYIAEELSSLPIYSHKDYVPKPTVVYTYDEEEADDLVAGLKAGPVALDMEWRVLYSRSFGKPALSERRTSVVQVADGNGLILVIQVFPMNRFPKKLQELIENSNVPKVGVNILNDGKKLFRDYGILAQNLVELGALAQIAHPSAPTFGNRKRKIVSLAKLVERYCGKVLEKGSERTGNWEAKLDLRQLDYAANDAHSSLMIYRELLNLAKESDIDVFSNEQEQLYSSSVKGPSNAVSTRSLSEPSTSEPHQPVQMRSQYLKAYKYWHERNMSMEQMCIELSLKSLGYGTKADRASESLKPSTVISYIIGALQADSTLSFKMENLRQLVQMDANSWIRHREWLIKTWEIRIS